MLVICSVLFNLIQMGSRYFNDIIIGDTFDYQDSKLFSPDSSSVMEKQEPGIVNTVMNTIRELATRIGRMEQLRDCPICGDSVTGQFSHGPIFCV